MSYIYLVRHGQTLWNEQKRYQGHSDIVLSTKGIKKVKVLAKAMKNIKIDAVYCSGLQRTAQTAQVLMGKRKLKLCADLRLNEMNFGQWEGKTAQKLFALKDKSFASFVKGGEAIPPGGESSRIVNSRVRKFWKDCLKKHPNEDVLIVSHSAPIKMMVLEALGLPLKFMFNLHLDPASLTILRRYDQYFQLIGFNTHV